MTIYSNPRTAATIDNWPIGRNRCVAQFSIERDKRGERAVRVTVGAPKKLTYARQARIVDGDDGRTYIANLSQFDGLITIMRGDMKYQHEAVFERDPRYAGLLALFD